LQQFNHVWQQKRRALVVTSNHNSSSLSSLKATASNYDSTPSISSSITHSSIAQQSSDHGETTRTAKLRHDLLRSTVDYNTQLQRERFQERKACFDLQTMQIHYPLNRQYRLPPVRTKIGSYPLALVPGQYHDAYIKYQSNELKYMPINTALYYYPKPLSLVRSERFSQQVRIIDERSG
jgi:hypothetical protein